PGRPGGGKPGPRAGSVHRGRRPGHLATPPSRAPHPGRSVKLMAWVRVRFVKLGKVRWTSHRDVARLWERAFRRTGLALAYTGGFSPRPRVSFGLALPTGHESRAEYLDLETTDESLDVSTLPARLSAELPTGIDATAAAWIEHGMSLQEEVRSCSWRWKAVPVEGSKAVGSDELAARVSRLLAATEVVVTRTRKGQPVTGDIRPEVLTLQAIGPVDAEPLSGVWLEAELASQPR